MSDVSIRQIASKVLHRGGHIQLTMDTFKTADGKQFRRETIRHPASVVILPVLSGNRVVLIRQFRSALGRYIHEIPAGTSEPKEPLERCARRELAEEAGYKASKWTRLHEFYPAPGVSTERMVLYRAEGLSKLSKAPDKDHDEYITTVIVPAREAIEMVKKNRIVDAKSIIGILFGLKRICWS
jgi:ADP-ribose pyrophosphatase